MRSGEFDQEKRIEINLMSEFKVTPKNLRLYEVCIFVTLDFFSCVWLPRKRSKTAKTKKLRLCFLINYDTSSNDHIVLHIRKLEQNTPCWDCFLLSWLGCWYYMLYTWSCLNGIAGNCFWIYLFCSLIIILLLPISWLKVLGFNKAMIYC